MHFRYSPKQAADHQHDPDVRSCSDYNVRLHFETARLLFPYMYSRMDMKSMEVIIRSPFTSTDTTVPPYTSKKETIPVIFG